MIAIGDYQPIIGGLPAQAVSCPSSPT